MHALSAYISQFEYVDLHACIFTNVYSYDDMLILMCTHLMLLAEHSNEMSVLQAATLHILPVLLAQVEATCHQRLPQESSYQDLHH